MRSLIAFITVFGFFGTAYGAGTVELSSKATVRAAMIRVGDVADVVGLDRHRRARVQKITLGKAPHVGQSKYVPRSYVERRIRDVVGGGLAIKGPARIKVSRAAQRLKGDDMRALVRAEVEALMPHEPNSVALIKVPRIPDLTVPYGAQARVQFEDDEDFVGLVRAELIIESGGRRVNTRRLNISVDLYAKSYGVTSELKRGHVLTREDFMVLQVPASQMPRDAIERPELFEGSELRRRVRPGEPLRQAWFKVPPVVARGDRVRIIARRGSIQLTTLGQALNNASHNTFVRVRNLDSKKVVTGRATAPGVVEMEF